MIDEIDKNSENPLANISKPKKKNSGMSSKSPDIRIAFYINTGPNQRDLHPVEKVLE